jgi:uracil-DNA glycosylase
MQRLTAIVERIRAEQGISDRVAGFDPANGNEAARFLFVLEAPGPGAIASKKVSLDNDDLSARNLRMQMAEAGVDRVDIALWNIVPWYLGNDSGTQIRAAVSADIRKGLRFLDAVIEALPRLEAIVLVGGAARQAHVHLSHTTSARILSCHHPSPRVQNINRAAAEENVRVFRRMLANAAER